MHFSLVTLQKHKCAWKALGIWSQIKGLLVGNDIRAMLGHMGKNFVMPCLQLFGCLIWVLWQERNGTLHGSFSRSTIILLSGLEYMFGEDTEKKKTERRPQQAMRSQRMKACDRTN
ncbi:hypothetical protein Fot_53657 [Forsythia ovata]|uniref:Uncharacterized protein n=1 Tax=Forsythia ovata TaxID=205694 RepID=A0ABD1PEW3_9LAMI